VRLCTNKTTGQVAAVKIIKKPKGSKMAIIKSEVDILKSVEHPYIVRCFDAIDSPDKMYLVMEIMKGGELFDRILDKGHFTEADAAGDGQAFQRHQVPARQEHRSSRPEAGELADG